VATFMLIHGGGDVGFWYWRLVERERGRVAMTPSHPNRERPPGLAARKNRQICSPDIRSAT
jgi:hypothetical protein